LLWTIIKVLDNNVNCIIIGNISKIIVQGAPIMSYTVDPKRIEDEAIERLHYGNGEEVNSFTLNRFYQSLENEIRSSKFDAKTFIALGLVLFNMKKFDLFIEEHERGKRFFSSNLDLHKNYTLGRFRMVERGFYDIPGFDLYNSWFDPNINNFDSPFKFIYGSKRILYAANLINLERDNIAKVVLYANRRVSFEFGPFTFDREYDELRNENMSFDESFSWEVTERIREGKLTEIEDLYLKEILGSGYSNFMSLADPDYAHLLDIDNESGESYNSVEEFMESLVI